MNKPIISTWGIGPSYRNRVKQNILEAINSGYENTMDYIVLTDDPEDFYEFAEATGKIKAIIDIHEERKDYPWSIELEKIPPKTKIDAEYGTAYVENLSKNENFSYALHRFSLPTISFLGYNKIVFMDSDVKIKYDMIGKMITEEEFWEEFNTEPDTMKGCVAEEVYVGEADFHGSQSALYLTRAMGSSQSQGALQLASIVMYHLYDKHEIKHKSPVILRMPITEGPFRYYHFNTSEKVKSYFDIWNEAMHQIFKNPHLLNYQRCGGYTMCDYMPVAIANIFHDIKVEDFPSRIYVRRIFYEDRYFMPPMAAGMSTSFEPATSREEFFEKNKELVEKMFSLKAWPHHEPY